MANNWEDVAEYLLRNRSIREMVDEVLKSLEETDHDCHVFTVKNEEHKNKKNKEKESRRLGMRQRQQLLKQYKHKKTVTQETEKEIAKELNLSQVIVTKWFNNRRRREALRIKRNGMINITQQNSIHMTDCFIHEDEPLQINYIPTKHRNISLHSNTQSNVGVTCEVSDEVEITAVKKFDCNQNYRKNLTGFVVTQDENGICVLHEQ